MGKRGDQPSSKQSCPIETELRLTGDPRTLEQAFDSSFMPSHQGQDDKLSDLKNSYFDTEDRQLRANGLALRVRADGTGSQRQTLKAGDGAKAALLKRREWEMVIDQDQPDLGALPKNGLALLPKSARQGGLQKAFETRVKRRTRKIEINGQDRPASLIEAALDFGEIVTESGSLPIAEIELELLDGPSPALYELALSLQSLGPLHLETRSKSSRAYDQLSDQPPSWQRAATPPLTSSDTVDDAMAAIFASCFDQWLSNQAAAIDGTDPEGVHQMRVGLRRLRSALSIFRKLIPDHQFARLKEDARNTANILGPARDWDVFQSELLAPVAATRTKDKAWRALQSKARTQSRARYRRMRQELAKSDYVEFVLRFGQWVEERGWQADADLKKRQRAPISAFAIKILKKRHKRALNDGANFAKFTTEQRHDLRIVLKKLRYTAEFFTPLFDKKTAKRFLRSVKTLQNGLGHLNDVAVAETLLGELLARPGKVDLTGAAGMVIGWHAHSSTVTESGLLRSWENFAGHRVFWG